MVYAVRDNLVGMTDQGAAPARDKLLAFIDEAGQRSNTPKSSAHFTIGAVAFKEVWDPQARALLQALRAGVGRRPDHELHFVKMGHHERLYLAREIARQTAGLAAPGKAGQHMLAVTVTVCKRRLAPKGGDYTEHHTYLWALRLLLERLSWLARDNNLDLHYTLAHVTRFPKARLREYEARLKGSADCKVAWTHVPRGGAFSTPKHDERLQLADIVTSATWQAFEEKRGFVEPRYVQEFQSLLWRRGNGNLLSYGLKIVPAPDIHGPYGWAVEMEKTGRVTYSAAAGVGR